MPAGRAVPKVLDALGIETATLERVEEVGDAGGPGDLQRLLDQPAGRADRLDAADRGQACVASKPSRSSTSGSATPLVVTSLGTPSYLVHAAGDRPLNFYMWAAMGMASSTGLGLALAQPDRRVVVVDGDGAAVMNLNGMVTVAASSPSNLLWVILENGAFLETGGQQIATHGPADLVAIAQGCGIEQGRPRRRSRGARPRSSTRDSRSPARRWSSRASTATACEILPPVDPVRVKHRFMDALGT